ncbi:MAG: AIR carboxylase family protein [archaeon]
MILIIFGSKSDSHIYEPLLKSLGNQAELRIASAHKSPNYLNEVLKDVNDKYKLIIAGAGLAAHLPGVIASKTIRPIIGLPVNVNFEGIDSLLSIVQMPPSVPVLSVGVDNWREAGENARLMLIQYSSVNIMNSKLVDKAGLEKISELLSSFDVKFDFSDELNLNAINIRCINITEIVQNSTANEKCLAINIPISEHSNLSNVKDLFKLTKKGMWVGLNRFENAAIAAVQIINLDNQHSEKLISYKRKLENMFKK